MATFPPGGTPILWLCGAADKIPGMGSQLANYAFYALGAVAACVWAIIIVRAWAPAANRRGGFWELEALMLIIGPATAMIVAFYPPDAPGMLGSVNRALMNVSYALAIGAIGRGLIHPSKKTGGLVAAIALYYLSLILSGIGGAVPGGFTEAYWLTPLLVLAFLLSPGFTLDWFLRMSRLAIRAIVALSLLAATFVPEIAFNLEEKRQVFGIPRVEGITQHPNVFGIIATIGIVLELKNASKGRAFWLLVMGSGLVLAQSSTAYIATLLGVLMISTRFTRRLRLLAALTAAAGAILAIALPEESRKLSALLTEDALTKMLNGRVEIWDAALAGFRQSPWFGYGPSLLDEQYRQLYLPNFDAAAQAHNQWYQSLGGAGIVGAAALIILLLTLASYAFKARVHTSGLSLALLVVLLVRCVSETPLRPVGASTATLMILIVIGVLAAANREINSLPSAEDSDDAHEPAPVRAVIPTRR
ncbi:O-antigen ligase family protein [Arthrobacter globiformis]|uniref:O-antigen ligase family protein n=1 Tax=Arthrobacter globiformis TaxID=1665 RepID=UPI000B40BAC6|nr:O-antigen ligase family protein [Arthrobacter globiformis]